MATKYWLGTATVAAQVSTATFATYDVTTTRKITIGGVVISALDTGGNLTAALAALATLLNASTHPYFSGISWSSDATHIIGTADTAGVAFVFAGSVSGGTGTCSNAFTSTTANSGPSDWSVATNWSTGAVPVNGDAVILKDNSVNIAYGLDQSAVTLASLTIYKSYTGKIGLDRTGFAADVNGGSLDTTKVEYRAIYLAISATVVDIGQVLSTGSPAGSGRIMLNLGGAASEVTVYGTAAQSADVGRAAFRFLGNHASININVRSAPGGIGVAVDAPGEISTINKVAVSDISAASYIFVGPGTTLAVYQQSGGIGQLQAAATIGEVIVDGGVLTTEGDYTITACTVNGGTLYMNHAKTGADEIITLNLKGGTVDTTQSSIARNITTVNLTNGTLNNKRCNVGTFAIPSCTTYALQFQS